MSENRSRILDMLSEGKINVDEAERLLEAMSKQAGEEGTTSDVEPVRKPQPKYLRVFVEPNPDAGPGVEQHHVNVRVPVALLRAVSPEALGGGHLVDGRAHGVDDRRSEREGHVADPEPDDRSVGMGLLECPDTPLDLGKEIAGLQLPVALVHLRHGRRE